MKISKAFYILILVFLSSVLAGRLDVYDIEGRRDFVRNLRIKKEVGKRLGRDAAKRAGMKIRFRRGGALYEVMGVGDDGRIMVYKTNNEKSALTVNVDDVLDVNTFGLSGDGVLFGVWDGGFAKTGHQEFGGRVIVQDGAVEDSHASHVTGTVAASGVDSRAKGMSPMGLIDAYDWEDDAAEMAGAGMYIAGGSGMIQVSNHSYGYVHGWDHDYDPVRWWGTFGDREDDLFGRYSIYARQWDEVCYQAKYYLPFKGVGNDRNDSAPDEGETFEYYNNGDYVEAEYDSSVDPYSDGWDNGGFDTIGTVASAKNIMTVGAIKNGTNPVVRDLNDVSMTSFSGWGPTDDGRVKPDIVTRGYYVYSCDNDSNSSYSYRSGTSMATPSASGSAGLLIEYYGQCFPGEYMLSSTIKGLMLHTADDLGNAGPDYKYGWGLLDIKGAVEMISDANYFEDKDVIVEDVIVDTENKRNYVFDWDGVSDIRVTVCWTDPEGAVRSGLDDSSLVLVNDLDLRVVDPCGTVYMPYILDPGNPDTAAVFGDNFRDNVEQVFISSPVVDGSYTVEVWRDGVLFDNQQEYSLFISGQDFGDVTVSGQVLTVSGNGIEGVAVDGEGGFGGLSDVDGYYSFDVPFGWGGGTVTANKALWDFVPVDVNIAGTVTDDVNGVNFEGVRFADLDGDGAVDYVDYASLSEYWQNSGCESGGWCGDSDLDLSGNVDWVDLQLLLEDWLEVQ